jgi:glutamate racemase
MAIIAAQARHDRTLRRPHDTHSRGRMDAARPLLVFDSGVGGLSVLDAIARRLPRAPIVYVADSGGFPYGTKTETEIATRVPALLGRLVERYQPRLVVIACNTASTIALATVRAALDLPIVGTVPAIKPAAALSKTRAIGVLGTEATVRQPYVDNLAREFASDCLVVRHGSARLVMLAEAALRGDRGDLAEYRAVMAGLLDQPGGDRIDTVVLACTHFPLVDAELAAAFGPGVALVDGADGIARRIADLTRSQSFYRSRPDYALFTRDGPDLAALSVALEDYELDRIDIF